MADFISELGMSITDEVKDGIRTKNINKEDFRENLQLLITRFSTFTNTLDSLSKKELKDWADKIYTTSNDRKAQFCKVYCAIAKRLGGKDLDSAFDSFYFAADKYKKMLEVMEKNINDFITEKSISVQNAKLSNVAGFGLLKQATIVCNFAIYMLDGVNQEIFQHNGVRELDVPKKYRFAYIERHQDDVTDILYDMLHKQGAYAFVNGVVALKKGKDDINLVDEDNKANIAFLTPNAFTGSISRLLKVGAKQFGIFRWLGEQWNLIKHAKYLKANKEKEQLSTHVALLKLALNDINPDDPEYQKQVKIINAYNEMLAKLDQKIDEYEIA